MRSVLVPSVIHCRRRRRLQKKRCVWRGYFEAGISSCIFFATAKDLWSVLLLSFRRSCPQTKRCVWWGYYLARQTSYLAFLTAKYPHLRHALLVQGEGDRSGRDRDGRGTLMFMCMSPTLWSTHTLTTNTLFKTQVVDEEKVRRNYDRQHEIRPSQQPRSCFFDCAFQFSTENWHWCKRLHLFSLYDVSIFICPNSNEKDTSSNTSNMLMETVNVHSLN